MTGYMDFFTGINLHGNELKDVVLDYTTLSAAPSNSTVGKEGQIAYYSGTVYVCTAVSGSTYTWVALATGGNTDVLTTRIGILDAKVGWDSANNTALTGGLIQSVGTSGDAASATGTVYARIAQNASDISGLSSGKVDKLQTSPAGTYYKVTVNAQGQVTTGVASLAESDVTGLTDDLALKAPLASPALTGTPTAPTATAGTNTTQIATTAFVKAAVDASYSTQQAMRFKGTVDGSNALPASAAVGDTYVVGANGTYAGQTCETGDMIVCTNATGPVWKVIQANIDGAVTGPASSVDSQIAVFNGATGKVIKDSGFTIATSVPANAVFTDTTYSAGTKLTLSDTTFNHDATTRTDTTSTATATNGGTFTAVDGVTTDATGHVTAVNVKTVTLPTSTDVAVTQTVDSTTATAVPVLASGVGDATGTGGAKIVTGVTVTPSSGTVTATTFSGALSGNASTASKIYSPVNIGLSGVTATAQSFDGSQGITIPVTAVPASLVNSGELAEARIPYVVKKQSITISSGTGQVAHGCAGGVCTMNLWNAAGTEIVYAELTVNGDNIVVNASTDGTYMIGWTGIRSTSS